MTRVHLTGAVAAGLLTVGILSPAVASASTSAVGSAPHAHGTSVFAHTASSTSIAPRLGTPASLTVVSSSLQLFPSLLGNNQANRALRG